jgi:ferritin
MKPQVNKAINEQINKELFSAYLYLAMAAYSDAEGFSGFAHWFKKQAEEEIEHAMRFYEFVNSRFGKVELEALDKPKAEFESFEDAFSQALEHEKFISQSIFELLELARSEKDYPLESMLAWFVDEQVEEEETAADIVDKLKIIGSSPQIYMLDRELAQRK